VQSECRRGRKGLITPQAGVEDGERR
jgi:hypothetical protein